MDEAEFERLARAFIEGLFTGVSAVQVKQTKLGEAGGYATIWEIRLVTAGNQPAAPEL